MAPAVLATGAGLLLSGHVPAAVFLALAVAVGLPHGGLDHAAGRRAFAARFGASWWRPFLIAYLGLVAATLLTWHLMPGCALLAFLGLSLYHFGEVDAAPATAWRPLRIAAHGGAVIVVPALCHPHEVERLFAVLAGADAHAVATLLGGPLAMAWGIAAAATLLIHGARGRTGDWRAAIDLIFVTLLFALASPLIAFSLYFAAIHTPRALAATLPADRRTPATLAVPVLLALLGVLLGAVIFIVHGGAAVGDNVVRAAFLLLSALTVPHMWLAWYAPAPCAAGRRATPRLPGGAGPPAFGMAGRRAAH